MCSVHFMLYSPVHFIVVLLWQQQTHLSWMCLQVLLQLGMVIF